VTRYEELDLALEHSDGARIPRTRPAVVAFLKEHGFDEADIDRVAMEASVDTLASVEGLALKHETRREEIFRELERRRERRAQQRQVVVNPQVNGRVRALAKRGSDEAIATPEEPSP
jgi:hypothetical protein